MMNICYRCGKYRADKIIDPRGPYAICPECGYKHSFLQLPLLIIGGPSGSGKTTIFRHLLGRMEEVILLEGDILWRPEYDKPDEKYREFFEMWLRLNKNISQSGRVVAIFCAGMVVPENVENCVERRYFSSLHYLALVCEEEELTNRLVKRPGWRKSNEPGFMKRNAEFNRWLLENGEKSKPKIELLDTTHRSIESTADDVAIWIGDRVKLAAGTTVSN
jgi:broad-specificity NMP kinase